MLIQYCVQLHKKLFAVRKPLSQFTSETAVKAKIFIKIYTN